MSRILKLDKKFYSDDGVVPLFRGDDWNLLGKVVDRAGNYETGVDLSPYSATAYFPSASGGPDLPAMAATGSCGSLTISMPAASTPNVQSNVGGIGAYVVLKDSQGNLTTVPTVDQAIAVLDRGFPS